MQVNMKFLRSHCDFFFLDNLPNELKEKKVYNNNRKEREPNSLKRRKRNYYEQVLHGLR